MVSLLVIVSYMLPFEYKIQPMDVNVKNKNAAREKIFKTELASMITGCYNVLNGAIMDGKCKTTYRDIPAGRVMVLSKHTKITMDLVATGGDR
jgi:hypothetical protein